MYFERPSRKRCSRHHARHRAAGAARVARAGLVNMSVAAVPAHKRADIADIRPRKGAFVCTVRPRCTQTAPFPPLNCAEGLLCVRRGCGA